MSFKKLGLLSLVMMTIFLPKSFGQDNCGPAYNDCYTNDCCFSDWVIYADWLYWRTRRCDLDYAVRFNTTDATISNLEHVTPRYNSGFRIGVAKEWCNEFFLEAFYTRYRTSRRDSVESEDGFLAGTRKTDQFSEVAQGNIGTASADWDLHYNTFDVLAGYQFGNFCSFESFFFGGFKYARITQELDTTYIGTPGNGRDDIEEEIKMRAYGVDFGLGAKYEFCGCFNFFGKTSIDVLLGNFERSFTISATDPEVTTAVTLVDLEDKCWAMVSVLNLAFGIGYDYTFQGCWCARVGISLGYEFHSWINTLDFLDFQAESDEITFDRHLQSLGFDGLFLRLAVGF